MIKKALPLFASLAFLSHSASAQGVELSVEGLKGKVEENVEVYLSAIPEEEYSTSLRFQSRLNTTITEALNALGYYDFQIDYEAPEGEDELIVRVSLGKPILIKEMDIVINGEASKDEDFLALIENSPLKVGKRLNQGQYDSLKSSIRNLALQKGYFTAEFETARLEVAPELYEANIRLHYNSGIRYRFGKLSISGSQIEEDRVYSLQPFEEGEPYSVNLIGEYNQNLSNTDWFSSVFVEPDLSDLGDDPELPIKVSLAPQARTQVETGLGFSTDVGVRGTVKFKRPWVNRRGHSFDTNLYVSAPEQQLTAGYKIPLEDVLSEYYQLQFGIKHLDDRDTTSLESNFAVERHWIAESGWHRTLYTRYLYENFSQGLQEDGVQFVLPGVSLSRTRSRGGSMPYWGDKQSVTLEYGDTALLSETRVLRVIGRSSWIRSLNENHRGLFRLEGGANITEEFEKLSPSLRFFAGGDNNLRGYSYESISPKDESGALTGAKYTATSSLEYQYRVYGNWWLAAFYDYGDAFNETPDFKAGTGVGIRWASPVGPVSLDFAWGLDTDPANEFQLHFSLGPEL